MEGIGQLHVAVFGISEQDVGGQVVVMVEQDVGFDTALGAAELDPRKQGQAQRDGGQVQRQKFVFEAEFVLSAAEHLLFPEAGRSGPEQFLKQGGRTVLIGIGQGRAARRLGDSQMDQSAQTARQTVADLAQRVGASQLTEQHGNELRPTSEALGITLGGVLLHPGGKFRPREVMEQLIEQACDFYDWIALLWAAYGEDPGQEWLANVNYRRASSLFQTARACFGQE